MAIAVGNSLGGDVVNTRTTLWANQRGQPHTEVFRQQLAHQPDVFFNQVEVIEQPLTGGCDTFVSPGAENVTVVREDLFTLGEPVQQIVGRLSGRKLVRLSQFLSEPLHLVDGKNFCGEGGNFAAVLALCGCCSL
jgi:hypothetical protein